MVCPLDSISCAWPHALVLVSECQPWSRLGTAFAISGSTTLRGCQPVLCASGSLELGAAPAHPPKTLNLRQGSGCHDEEVGKRSLGFAFRCAQGPIDMFPWAVRQGQRECILTKE